MKFIRKYIYEKNDLISTIAWILYQNNLYEKDNSKVDFTTNKIKLTKKNIIDYTKDMVIAWEYEQSFIQLTPDYDEQLYWEEAEKIYKNKFKNKEINLE